MAFTQPHYYFTFGGNLITAAEIWATGWRVKPNDGAPTGAELLTNLANINVNDMLIDCQDFISTKTADGYFASFSSATSVSWAKLAVIDTSGKYVGDPKVATGTKRVGSGGTSTPPPQLAVCVSLWSGSNFGRANHGRMYLPCPQPYLSDISATTGQTPSGNAAYLRDSVKTLISHATGEVSTILMPCHPVIMSQRGLGETKPLLQISAGNVIDTMRSRRNNLVDAPNYVAYP